MYVVNDFRIFRASRTSSPKGTSRKDRDRRTVLDCVAFCRIGCARRGADFDGRCHDAVIHYLRVVPLRAWRRLRLRRDLAFFLFRGSTLTPGSDSTSGIVPPNVLRPFPFSRALSSPTDERLRSWLVSGAWRERLLSFLLLTGPMTSPIGYRCSPHDFPNIGELPLGSLNLRRAMAVPESLLTPHRQTPFAGGTSALSGIARQASSAASSQTVKSAGVWVSR